MRKQDQLVHLIQSLTPAEKKFFKEYVAKNNTGQSFMKLYEELQKADSYDTESLCRKLKKTKANLAHEKEYLQEVLFKALRDTHSSVTDIALSNKINNIFILNQRGCYEMAWDMAQKAIKECHQTSEYIALIKLYNVMLHIHFSSHPNGPQKYMEQREMHSKMEKALADMHTVSLFGRLNISVSDLWRRSSNNPQPKDREEARSMLAGDLMAEKYTEPLFRKLQASHLGTLYYILGQKEKAAEWKLEEVKIMEDYPLETGVDEQSYVIGVENSIIHMLKAGMLSEAEAYIAKIASRHYHKLPLNNAFLDRTFDTTCFKYIMSMRNTEFILGRRDKKDLQEVLKKFEKIEPKITSDVIPQGQITYYLTAAKVAFLAENYDAAMKWCNVAIDLSRTANSLDIQTSSRIALAIIHYEFGSYSVARSMAVAATYFIKKLRPLSSSEKGILKFLSNEGKNTDRVSFERLKKDLVLLQDDPAEKAIQGLFFYDVWIDRNLGKLKQKRY